MNELPKTDELELPAHFERRFSVHLYLVSHGLLLLRSGKTNTDSTRIDILFQDVVWMMLPAWFDGLSVSAATLEALPLRLPPFIQKEAAFRRAYRLTTEDVDHFIIAGGASFAEDTGMYFGASILLPNPPIPLKSAPQTT